MQRLSVTEIRKNATMTTPGEIIKTRRDACKWTQTELSRRSGVHLNTLRDIEGKGGELSSKLPALAEALGIDALALSKGRLVEMHAAADVAAAADIVINRYDTGGAMGNGLELPDQPGVVESMRVSQEWLQKNVRHYTAVGNLRIVTGFGDSMRPLYNPGDPLIVDCGVLTVDFDAIYFFRVGNHGFIKRLQRIPSAGGLTLQVISDNDRYPPWPITPDIDFEVFGRVLKVWRSEDF